METLISIDKTNIDREHICCAMGKDGAKKAWMKQQFPGGLKFERLDERGKVFIEYVPIESAWKPLEGENWLVIHCLWVSGKFKARGWAAALMEECLRDARERDKSGILYVAGRGKEHYLTDKKFFLHRGFKVVDEAPPYFELLALPLDESAPPPRFSNFAKTNGIPGDRGFRFAYTDQCPFMEEYVPLMAGWAREKGFDARIIKLESPDQVRAQGSPFGTLGIWFDGRFVTHVPQTEKSFNKLLTQIGI